MAFLDKVTNVAGKAIDKGGEIVETTKLKSKISGMEKDIVSLKCDVAEFYLKKREQDEEVDPTVEPILAQILEKYEEIEEIKEQIQELKR